MVNIRIFYSSAKKEIQRPLINTLRKQMKHMSETEPQEISESENHFSAWCPNYRSKK